jgi:hypothetical protein
VAGYGNRIVTLRFPEISETDPDGNVTDMIFVSLKNPMVVPPGVLKPPGKTKLGEDGLPVDFDAATADMNVILSRLIVAWHAYDADDCRVDYNGDPTDQELLGLPATPELVARLPQTITLRMAQLVGEAVNPP